MPPRSRLAWCWTVVILALCWFPREYMGINERSPRPFFVPNFDKLVHLGIFAVFATLWMRVGSSGRRAWWIFLAGVALAIISEVGQQSSLVNRDANVADGLADTAGVIVGLIAFGAYRRHLERRTVPAGG